MARVGGYRPGLGGLCERMDRWGVGGWMERWTDRKVVGWTDGGSVGHMNKWMGE